MSETVGEAVVRIRSDETGFDPADSGKRAGDGYAKGFGGAIKGIGVGIAAALAAGKAVQFLGDAVGEARESQKVAATTTQIIKSTGSAANVTAGQVGDLAGALSAKAGVDDELVQSGANLLLTFKNVRNEAGKSNDIFNQATAAALDLSAAGFGSVESASVMLGKALNDPTKGISALGRAGVTFTQAQKDQVKALQESGDLLGAQKIILGEVKGQVGGVATATATAGEKASVAWGNIKESVGTLLLPALDAVANVFTTAIAPAVQTGISALSGLGPVFSSIGDAIGGISKNAGVGKFIDSMVDGFQGLLVAVKPVIAQIGPALASLGDSIGANVLPVLSDIGAVITGQVVPAVTAFVSYAVANLLPVFQQVWSVITSQVIPTIASLASFFYTTLYPAIFQIVTTVISNLKPAFDALVAVFVGQVLPTVQRLVEQIRTQLIPALTPVISTVVQVIGFLAKLAATILGVVLPPLFRIAGFIIANVVPAVVSIITWVAKFVGGLISLGKAIGSAVASFARFYTSLVTGVARAVSSVVTAIAALPGKIIGFVGRMLSAGKDLIGGLFSGITSAASSAGGFVSGLAGKIADAVKGAINNALNLPLTISLPKIVGGGTFTVLPRLQSGSLEGLAEGGEFRVGEVGPERVYLPAGTRVLSAAQTRQADSRGSIDYAALGAAVAAALAPVLAAQRPVSFALPSGDPEAAAMAAINRLATV